MKWNTVSGKSWTSALNFQTILKIVIKWAPCYVSVPPSSPDYQQQVICLKPDMLLCVLDISHQGFMINKMIIHACNTKTKTPMG